MRGFDTIESALRPPLRCLLPDLYLEHPELWAGVHHWLITMLAEGVGAPITSKVLGRSGSADVCWRPSGAGGYS
ncbi:MAG: DUF4058 family protein [Leptolyngbyaceae cyanobacterium]